MTEPTRWEGQRGFADVQVGKFSPLEQVKHGSVTAVWFSGRPHDNVSGRLFTVAEMFFYRVSWICCLSWLCNPMIPAAAKLAELLAVPWRLFRFIVLGKPSGVLRHEFRKAA